MSLRLRSRRQRHQLQPTQQLIVFPLRQDWFALRLQAVQKVLLGEPYAKLDRPTVQWFRYQDQEIPVLEGEQQLFGSCQHQPVAPRYILLIPIGIHLMGLAIDRPPTLRRVPESAIGTLSPTDMNRHSGYVSSIVIPTAEEPPLFLLEPARLRFQRPAQPS